MVRAYGQPMARRLASRLQQLEAATVLQDMRTLPQARAHELKADRNEQVSLDLVHPRRLILTVADDPIPRRGDGGIDWASVTSVIVEEIVDTHE
jgi:proteic killer suppression protein